MLRCNVDYSGSRWNPEQMFMDSRGRIADSSTDRKLFEWWLKQDNSDQEYIQSLSAPA